ncbi:MAG: hypothetical protein WC600_12990, partial [Desulfobaccales bacterium]
PPAAGGEGKIHYRTYELAYLEYGVDEGRDGRTAGEDHQSAKKQERQDDGQQPKFFPDLEEAPQILGKIHNVTPWE